MGVVVLEFYTPCNISATANARDFRFCTWVGSLSLVMSECSLSGRGQGHVSNFYIVDFRHSKSSVYRRYTQLHRRRFVYDAWDNGSRLDRSRHGWVHIVYHALPPTKSPTSYHRFGQDLSYK